MIYTISRQPGCGGLEIGQRLARRLNVPYIDKKTVSGAASDLSANEEKGGTGGVRGFLERLSRTPIIYDLEAYIPDIGSVVSDTEVDDREAEILLQLVGDGPCVVVGRGGFHRLKDKENVFNVFLCGDLEYRQANYMKLYNMNKKEATDLLYEADHATERYIERITGCNMYDLRNYHMTINVTNIDFNRAIESVIEYAHHYF